MLLTWDQSSISWNISRGALVDMKSDFDSGCRWNLPDVGAYDDAIIGGGRVAFPVHCH